MRNWLGIGLASVLLTGGLVTACSSNAAPVDQDPVKTFCGNKAKAECVVASACGVTNDDCLTAREAACETAATAALASGTRSFTQANVSACLNEINSAYVCSGGAVCEVPFASLFGTGSIDDLCNQVFQGSAKQYGTCTSNYDCTNGDICAPASATSTATVCGPVVQVTPGDPCGEPGQECPMGTYCSAAGAVPQCATRPGLNAACDEVTTPCLESLRCVSGVCTATAGAGQACNPTRVAGDPNADCNPSVAGYCDPNAGNICTKGLSFATGADDCNAYGQGGGAGGDAGIGVVDSGGTADTGTASDTGSATDAGGGG
jgi:hypothetical protein